MDVSRVCIHVATQGSECRSPHIVSDVVTRLAHSDKSVRLVKLTLAPVLDFELLVDGVDRVRVAASPHEDVTPGEQWFYAAKNNAAVRFNALRKARGVVVSVSPTADDGGEATTVSELPMAGLLAAKSWPEVWSQCVDDDDWSVEGFVSRVSDGRARPARVQDTDYLSDAAFEQAIAVVLAHAPPSR
jgi:hypothetical protein